MTAKKKKQTAERELYAPVKAFLEKQGYQVKAEVRGCDAVGLRGDEPPAIVELKRKFNLDLVLQGVARLGLSDRVYLAVDGATARGIPCFHDMRELQRWLAPEARICAVCHAPIPIDGIGLCGPCCAP